MAARLLHVLHTSQDYGLRPDNRLLLANGFDGCDAWRLPTLFAKIMGIIS